MAGGSFCFLFVGLAFKPGLNKQTFSSNIALDEAAKQSNIIHRAQCWMEMIDADQTFSGNILYNEQCLVI